MRLILDDDSSTESRAVASRERSTREAGPEANMIKEKEASAGKRPWTSEVRSTPVEPSRAIRKDKGKAVLMEKVSPRQDEVPSAGEDTSAEESQSQAFNATDVLCVQVLQKRLAEEVEKPRYSEKAYEGLREEVERAKCVTVNLLSRLEACRPAYNAESLRVDELTAAEEKKEQEYDTELAARAKKLAEYEASRISDLELIEKLEAQCNKLRSQRTQAEEQLCNMEH
ncbi:hypothetical protein AXG93_3841s1030 [Marchantia polymorpha subsp. ruderalis]|uniref:Uncharacterized protein n=1 Tax=Marchantia polymorpha subsp. ruderalis TaxID=1480154 RepID=A0A176W1T3_MARPO|nr:hypothetical protein AXG93_3841s1030 [Marchantia polymorpha subsp. ruderalis]